ncbi:hypothetical protein QUC32_03450 [Novosphingobium resinovorum]|uniref:hypothetical protein n=1 Tax=Novosphingobium TaxID=165696 RepID=UPI001B3C615C|nr:MULTISPECIES: hypothetical protein [Novosphingobium]MBF7013873.1 hypothetical protein [Novosphingobium sp. HR1a]WJM26020.1 hypothetical protein QUC32_03450 [Novosphingobium resinovorum]
MAANLRTAYADPRRKARFREIARGIVAKDRYNRKHGLAVDTAGAIAQALERAYRDGTRVDPSDAAPAAELSDTDPLEWALIPPRPRDAFWTICLFTLGREIDEARDGYLAPTVTERGTPGWLLVVEGYRPEKAMGDRTIAPLVRLRLLGLRPDDSGCLIVTERGSETWQRFCHLGGRYPEDLTDI